MHQCLGRSPHLLLMEYVETTTLSSLTGLGFCRGTAGVLPWEEQGQDAAGVSSRGSDSCGDAGSPTSDGYLVEEPAAAFPTRGAESVQPDLAFASGFITGRTEWEMSLPSHSGWEEVCDKDCTSIPPPGDTSPVWLEMEREKKVKIPAPRCRVATFWEMMRPPGRS